MKRRIKVIEKKRRLEAQLFEAMESNINQSISETKKWLDRQAAIKENIEEVQEQINQKTQKLSQTTAKVKLKDMPEARRYNRLKKESKMFMNIIKMIAYRSETALFNLIKPSYINSQKDGRQLIQAMLCSSANIQADYQNNILQITIHSQPNPRANHVLKNLCKELNETETVYPLTNLKIVYNCIAP